MSEIKFKSHLKKLMKDIALIPDEFFVRTNGGKYNVVWFLDRQKPSVEANYSFDEERFGMTKDGRMIWGFDSGCSCPSPWSSEDFGDTNYLTSTWKEFEFRTANDFDAGWDDVSLLNIEDYLKLIEAQKDQLPPSEVLKIQNSEIRRYLIKRVGYENIKNYVKATVLHQDGDSELLSIKTEGVEERYVKVKDSSTDREYLLYVPDNIERCKQAIAWTFGLEEKEYAPLIES